MAEPAVRLSSVTKRFGEATAVDRLDLDIAEGEFFTLLGASGCGKTTTLRLIAGFDLPTSGRVAIGGLDVSETPPHLRPVHTVFQSYALFPHMDVVSNVTFPLEVRGVAKAERRRRAMAALDLVRMADFAGRKPSQLSGGQQQRVALARALVGEPRVLLLDEPLGALDLKLRKEMQLELKQMQRRLGLTFVFVTHDQEEALAMSDRIALMRHGRIVQLDSPAGLYDSPSSVYAAEFIGEANLLRTTLGRDKANRPVLVWGGQTILPTGSPPPLPTTSPITVAVRPEAIDILDPSVGPQPESWTVEGRLRDATFVGTDVRLVFDTPEGPLVLRRQNRPGMSALALGEVRRLVVPASAVRPLSD